MKIGILGAGISGLSIARLLADDFEVEVFEKEEKIGGIAKTKIINNIPYHLVGGHCFNSKNPAVLNFIFQEIMPLEHWQLIIRKSKIKFNNHLISYPIEFSLNEIEKFDKNLFTKILDDLKNAVDDGVYPNLKIWFYKKFGTTLSDSYFIPYNHKIWGINPENITVDWIKDKLPTPNKEDILKSLHEQRVDKMVHQQFYYPKTPYYNLIDAFSKSLTIKKDFKIESLAYNKSSKKWLLNTDFEVDKVISTLPLNDLIKIIEDVPEDVKYAANNLKYNTITTTLWESKASETTWTYIPDESSIFHRYIHIGNFLNEKVNYTITEAIGKIDQDIIEIEGKKDDFLVKPLAHYQSSHAYVVYDENRTKALDLIKQYLNEIGIISHGRFGDWDYYNMDVCIEKSMKLAKLLKKKLL